MRTNKIRKIVQTRYGGFAKAASSAVGFCCGKPAESTCCALEQGLYAESELVSLPEIARNLSRGCGNPSGFANLQPGEVVVDFGCGCGIDVILAARRLGTHGRVYGVDFTPPMIERAKQAVAQADLRDVAVEMLDASLEDTGLPRSCADVVISNCVINLCPDKAAAYREAFRILRPGGRLAVSDILLSRPIDAELRERLQTGWAGCTGGALPEDDYWSTLRSAGFTELETVARHVLSDRELDDMARCPGEAFTPAPAVADLVRLRGAVESVKFTAIKPPSGDVA
ncbi:MAG: Arsenite methyltransferase [Gammaproteobacteria bacterium]|nr:Arsenite methyltransferase [Gammaproteobacteria bacterium]